MWVSDRPSLGPFNDKKVAMRVAPSKTLGVLVALCLLPQGLWAQPDDTLTQDLRRIFEHKSFELEDFGPAKWLDQGTAYTVLEPPAAEPAGNPEASDSAAGEADTEARDVVRYDTATAQRTVMVEASKLIPKGSEEPLPIDDYAWSKGRAHLLIYTNSQRVWRQKTRGDYWLLTLATGELRQLGGKNAAEASLMFAKFSPQGDHVAYVRENNLYVEHVAGGEIVQLTTDGSPTRLNGIGDWVYEEELGIRDGFRWSPDGKRLAYYQFDDSEVGIFTLINTTDSLYPTLQEIPYPKTGTTNPAVRVGTVAAEGGETRWIRVSGDPRQQYIARMEWAERDDTLMLQLLNRQQNQNDVLWANVTDGKTQRAYRDSSETWLDVVDEVLWLDDGQAFLWLSEKGDWRHLYRVSRDGSSQTLLTDFAADVISMVGVDESRGRVYFIASPVDATARYLYRARLDGSGKPERVTPQSEEGSHSYDMSPDGNWAFHTWSSFNTPPTTALISLPDHRRVRVLADNEAVQWEAADLLAQPVEFFTVEIGDAESQDASLKKVESEPSGSSVSLDSWLLRPNNLDPDKTYPLLVYVYGEPAGQTVVNRWGGSRALFHRALAKAGYLVASFDNRGTPAPKGKAWRKIIYGTVGDLSSREQAAAVRVLAAKHDFIDTERMAIWGWSGGGSNTLNLMFRFPGLYQAGISVAPVPDQRLYDTLYQERYMGSPDDNSEGYLLGSPIHFAEGLEGHLLLIHGTGDDNVHYQGTERLVNRLIELDKPFDLMAYPNRSHAIREGQGTQLHVHRLIARYLNQHLQPSRDQRP